MQEQGKIEAITDNIKSYIGTNYELVKLQATERSAVIGSGMISGLLLGVVTVLLILFVSLWAGLYLSHQLGDSYSGFAIVAGFYLLVAIVLLFGGKQRLEKNIRNRIINKLLNTTQN